MKFQLGIVLALSLGTFSTPVPAQQAREKFEITVDSGSTARVWRWAHFDAACKTTGLPVFTMGRSPEKGTLRIVDEAIEIVRVSSEDRKKCVGQKLPGRTVYIDARPDASGTEKFILLQNRGTRSERRIEVNVTYR